MSSSRRRNELKPRVETSTNSRHLPNASSDRHDQAVILVGMTHKVGPKGQVVIPIDVRTALGIEPGDEVDVWQADEQVIIRPARSRRPLRGRFKGSALTAELERSRSEDRRREDHTQ